MARMIFCDGFQHRCLTLFTILDAKREILSSQARMENRIMNEMALFRGNLNEVLQGAVGSQSSNWARERCNSHGDKSAAAPDSAPDPAASPKRKKHSGRVSFVKEETAMIEPSTGQGQAHI